jgi:hypothetical protein
VRLSLVLLFVLAIRPGFEADSGVSSRLLAFLSIGHVADKVGTEMKGFLDAILQAMREGLQLRGFVSCSFLSRLFHRSWLTDSSQSFLSLAGRRTLRRRTRSFNASACSLRPLDPFSPNTCTISLTSCSPAVSPILSEGVSSRRRTRSSRYKRRSRVRLRSFIAHARVELVW